MISVVIPAYNEEGKLPSAIKKIREYLSKKGHDYEIIVVDDGSSDKTSSCVQGIDTPNVVLLKNEKNMGKGYSVRRGVLSAKGDLIMFTDADLSTPIEELDRFLEEIKENDIVIGSRSLPESNIEVPQGIIRNRLGKIFGLLVNRFVIKGIGDSQCGFKLFRRDTAYKIFPFARMNGFAFDVEILLIAKKLGKKIKILPITWRNSASSRLHPIIDSTKMFIELIKIKINEVRGFYG